MNPHERLAEIAKEIQDAEENMHNCHRCDRGKKKAEACPLHLHYLDALTFKKKGIEETLAWARESITGLALAMKKSQKDNIIYDLTTDELNDLHIELLEAFVREQLNQ